MAELKTGSRWRSAVCNTEVMVIATPPGDVDLRCGGVPMVPAGTEPPKATASPDASKGTQLGKRYVNEGGKLEVLCTKPGTGSVGLAATLLALKEAKPLPSSD
jgi:hypothetical protein